MMQARLRRCPFPSQHHSAAAGGMLRLRTSTALRWSIEPFRLVSGFCPIHREPQRPRAITTKCSTSIVDPWENFGSKIPSTQHGDLLRRISTSGCPKIKSTRCLLSPARCVFVCVCACLLHAVSSSLQKCVLDWQAGVGIRVQCQTRISSIRPTAAPPPQCKRTSHCLQS